MEINNELLQVFNEEISDLIERSRNSLDHLLETENKVESFRDILRVIHTIKGNAGTVGYNDVKKYAHDLETTLFDFKNKEHLINKTTIDKINKFFDYLENIVTGEGNSEKYNADDGAKGEMEIFAKNEVDVRIQKIQEETSVGKEFEIFNKNEIEEVRNFTKINNDVTSQDPKSLEGNKNNNDSKKGINDFIRVPIERLQKNYDIISEIFLIRNQMRYLVEQYRANQIGYENFFQDWELLDNSLRKSIGEIENVSMSMRMTPVRSLLRRMEKTIRGYLETHIDKEIQISIEGEDVEIDKKIVDSLAEPLIHLTRNAMDHGIETRVERLEKGKSPQAKIKLSIQIIANEAVISVSDDGRGIDENKILNSAAKKGLDISNVHTKEEIINLIFLPGFSTVDKLSEVSGRGIGMDSVKSYVDSMGGYLSIFTEVNKGTEFTIRLPLGMSVVPVIIARANNIKFAILNTEVLELKKINISEVKKNGNDFYFKRKNDFIKCINIEDGLFCHYKKKSQLYEKKDKLSICIIGKTGKFFAVQIGEFIENAEIVLKEYPQGAPKFPYVTGISILATGEPTFLISLSKYCENFDKMNEKI
nr:chemotaxis protein CheA [Pigmentibacter ruber]